jgi:hypothetical protein
METKHIDNVSTEILMRRLYKVRILREKIKMQIKERLKEIRRPI